MKFEHFALNVKDARAMSQWYVQNLGLKVLRHREDEPFTHFLGDDTGRLFIELYSNPKVVFPDYASTHPLVFHFAFFTTDARADRARLEKVGASLFIEEPQPDGSMLIMLRDPFGVALQLCQRAKPFPGF